MRVDDTTVERWRTQATDWLRTKGFTPEQVTTGRDAWYVAQAAGINAEGYAAGLSDGHIQTALCKVFPNVEFQQAPTYSRRRA